MIFSRHRAAVIAGHRFLSNWNLQNIAPPLPRMGPPPLPPRRLSSFFPPMEPMPPRRISVTSEQALGNINLLMNHGKRKEDERSVSRICDDVPPPHPSGIPGAVADEPKPSNLQAPRGSTTSLACPYLSPIDVVSSHVTPTFIFVRRIRLPMYICVYSYLGSNKLGVGFW